MTPALPKPIAAYVAANAALDVDGMLKPFAADAVVYDDGRRHRGHTELRTWLKEAVIAAKAIFTPDTVRHETVRSWSKALPMATSRAARFASPFGSRSRAMPSRPWRSRYDHQS